MIRLSKKAENLLKEILDHRNEEDNCDTEYWRKRFEGVTGAEDLILRSSFKELQETDMISAKWADNYPYLLFVLTKGIEYFEEKEKRKLENSSITYTNNFYSSVGNIQLQQNAVNSTQTCIPSVNQEKLIELIRVIRQYDKVLEAEYGTERARDLRIATNDLEVAMKDNNRKIPAIISVIRDLSVNAGGGLIAAGVIQLIKGMMV